MPQALRRQRGTGPAPRPRTRRVGETPTSAMICWAETSPLPGKPSHRAATFNAPTANRHRWRHTAAR
jgi:hypothetical protein